MLDVEVPICAFTRWGHIETLSGHLEIDSGHLETVFWSTLRHPDWPHILYHILCVGCIWSKPLYVSKKVIAQVYDTTKIIRKSSITWSMDTDIDHPKKVISMWNMDLSITLQGGKWKVVSFGTIDQLANKSQYNFCQQACLKVPQVSRCPSLYTLLWDYTIHTLIHRIRLYDNVTKRY